jgi:hypothetical protein
MKLIRSATFGCFFCSLLPYNTAMSDSLRLGSRQLSGLQESCGLFHKCQEDLDCVGLPFVQSCQPMSCLALAASEITKEYAGQYYTELLSAKSEIKNRDDFPDYEPEMRANVEAGIAGQCSSPDQFEEAVDEIMATIVAMEEHPTTATIQDKFGARASACLGGGTADRQMIPGWTFAFGVGVEGGTVADIAANAYFGFGGDPAENATNRTAGIFLGGCIGAETGGGTETKPFVFAVRGSGDISVFTEQTLFVEIDVAAAVAGGGIAAGATIPDFDLAIDINYGLGAGFGGGIQGCSHVAVGYPF